MASFHLVILLLCLIKFLSALESYNDCKRNNGTMIAHSVCLPTSYAKHLRPTALLNRTTEIWNSISFMDLTAVNERGLTVTASLHMMIEWPEPRVLFNPVKYGNTSDAIIPCPDADNLDKLWMPKLYFQNLVQFQSNQPVS